MDRGVLRQILASYGVAYRSILAPQKGYRNSSYGVVCNDKTLNLILYKSEPGILTRIKNANEAGNFVASHGLPARQTASNKIIRLASPKLVKYGALYNYLPGNTIPWEAYTMAHIKALGKTMSGMHAVLAHFGTRDLPDVAGESLQLNKRMLHYFADDNVARALHAKLGLKVVRADFTKLLNAAKKFPNQQALHMDFVRGNILFEDSTITGILDFEKTARGHVLFDIARTLAFLLVDCKYKEETKIRKYFLHSGYIKRGMVSSELESPSPPAPSQNTVHSATRTVAASEPGKGRPGFERGLAGWEIQILEQLVNFFLLHDFYKFLRHNPYESLPQNQHFTRTKAMLLKRRLITRY
jgi:Ser/Thr protein kinase RdoA (MazF antagonist)